MTWQTYGSFALFALVVTLVPGPDFAVVTRNALAGGRRRGLFAGVGVAASSAVQGVAVALGLGAVIAASGPVFQTIRWVGVAYLVFLAAQALVSARRGRYDVVRDGGAPGRSAGAAVVGLRQGFLSNITNPKVLAFYLAVLPQFLPGSQSPWQAVPLALTHALISAVYLTLLVLGIDRARILLSRRRVRRWLDGLTGVAMLGFGARLAADGL